MSYRERQTRKTREAKTPKRLRQISTRDLAFCERHGISLADAHLWNRYPLKDYRP